MIPCRGCSRFIRTDAVHCPFCDAVVRDASSVLGVVVVGTLLGLGVPACGVIGGGSPTSTPDFGVETVDRTATETDTDTDTGATSTGADSSTGASTGTGTETGTGTGTGTGTETGTGTGTTSMG